VDWDKIAGLMTWPEWFGAITGLLCVWLAVKNHIANWFWGILSTVAYAYVFWNMQLYSSVALYALFFLPMQFYGWWTWKKGGGQDDSLPVTSAGVKQVGLLVVLAALFAVGWGYWMDLNKAAFPYEDAALTGLSIAAQYLQVRKKVECWWLWITVDLVYAFHLFPAQKLWPTTGLYVIFLGLAIMGLLEWRKLMQKTVAVTSGTDVAR
jgi:nicotinamide mononucleotide transporter